MRRSRRETATSRLRLVVPIAVMALGAAACGSGDGGTTDDAGSTLVVTGTDALEFDPATLSASAGTVTVEFTAEESVEHTFVIEELGDAELVAVDPGGTASGSIELEPGTYTFYCGVAGHRSAGMEGQLTVR